MDATANGKATDRFTTQTRRRPSFEERLREIEAEIANTPPPTPEEVAEQKRRRDGERRRQRNEKLAEFLRAAGALYRDATLDNFNTDRPGQCEAVDACREWADGITTHTSRGLLLFGPVGSGKDHLGIAAVRQSILKHGVDGRFVNGAELFGEIRDLIDTDRSEGSIIGRLVSPALLLLSDPLPVFGPLSNFQASTLYRICNGRYSLGKPTITTVNVASGDEAVERMGAATWDRLKSGAIVIFCNWPSHREPAKTVNC